MISRLLCDASSTYASQMTKLHPQYSHYGSSSGRIAQRMEGIPVLPGFRCPEKYRPSIFVKLETLQKHKLGNYPDLNRSFHHLTSSLKIVSIQSLFKSSTFLSYYAVWDCESQSPPQNANAEQFNPISRFREVSAFMGIVKPDNMLQHITMEQLHIPVSSAADLRRTIPQSGDPFTLIMIRRLNAIVKAYCSQALENVLMAKCFPDCSLRLPHRDRLIRPDLFAPQSPNLHWICTVVLLHLCSLWPCELTLTAVTSHA